MELELFFKIIFKKVYIQICDEVFSVKKYLPKLEPIWWITPFDTLLPLKKSNTGGKNGLHNFAPCKYFFQQVSGSKFSDDSKNCNSRLRGLSVNELLM